MDQVYTQKQIKEAWETYQGSHCWRYLRAGGKEAIRMTAPDTRQEGIINCRMVMLKTVMSFPKYLEVTYGG